MWENQQDICSKHAVKQLLVCYHTRVPSRPLSVLHWLLIWLRLLLGAALAICGTLQGSAGHKMRMSMHWQARPQEHSTVGVGMSNVSFHGLHRRIRAQCYGHCGHVIESYSVPQPHVQLPQCDSHFPDWWRHWPLRHGILDMFLCDPFDTPPFVFGPLSPI